MRVIVGICGASGVGYGVDFLKRCPAEEKYLRAGKKIHLLLVRYPDVKEAEAALQSFKRTYMPEVFEKGLLQTEDKKWIATKKVNEFVLIVFGASNEREGEELVKGTEKKIGEI